MYNMSKLFEVFHQYFVPNTLIHNYCARSCENLRLYNIRSRYGSMCVKFKVCHIWNELPDNIKCPSSSLKPDFRIVYYVCTTDVNKDWICKDQDKDKD